MGADDVSNIQVLSYARGLIPYYSGPITSSPSLIQDFVQYYFGDTVNFSSNKFAFLTGYKGLIFGRRKPDRGFSATHAMVTHFDYPGIDAASWYAAYYPKEDDDDSHAGWRFPNTVYAHVFKRDSHSSDFYGSVVIQYYFFISSIILKTTTKGIGLISMSW